MNLWAESSETSHVAYSAECRDIPANSDEPLRFMKSGSNDKAKSANFKHYDMEDIQIFIKIRQLTYDPDSVVR